jgi:hypothetical protein
MAIQDTLSLLPHSFTLQSPTRNEENLLQGEESEPKHPHEIISDQPTPSHQEIEPKQKERNLAALRT